MLLKGNGHNYGDWRRRGKRDPAGHVRGTESSQRSRLSFCSTSGCSGTVTTCADDEPGHDAGMLPMALAIGRGSEETAPLGRAVIGGLSAATLATLFLLPTVFGIVQKRGSFKSPSLDPEDPGSSFPQKPEIAS
jgi:AcrB/AcrD/AcrF family